MKAGVLGAGFTGMRIAAAAGRSGMSVVATRRTAAACDALEREGIRCVCFDGERTRTVMQALNAVTHLVVCVPPTRQAPFSDPVLDALGPLLQEDFPALHHVSYLSTIGVYGDHGGDWVDESTPCNSRQERSRLRRQAELAWQALARRRGVPLSVLRLSGIYGPGRNALCNAVNKTARVLVKPGQVFNRVHVDDVVTAVMRAMRTRHDGVLNISDDEPAPPQDVVRFAHALLGLEPPPPIAFETAELSPMARSFYRENKRVCNARSRQLLGMDYAYPDYRQGLKALWRTKDY